MVVCESNISNIIGGIENTGGVPLHHRRKLKQRFDIIKKLGQGTYGKVQLGINKETGQEVAIKTIKKCKIETEADLVRIRREIQIMSSVQHPNIIHIYEVFENREKMVLVMEYAAGGELYDYLSERKVLTEEEARRIFRQIVTAVYYCHKHKICHRDLKLENILLDEHGSAKIADFGLSNVFDERRLLSTFCGSPLYASPEIVQGTPYHGPEADCWSLGVLLYTLVYGAMPFDGSNFKRLVRQISHGDYFEPKKPSPASPLIREMLTVSPDQRANIEKICAHWWVNLEYKESCLDIAEELANQTPVRLDLLLSLAPPPPQVGSDKLVIADEASTSVPVAETAPVPTRSQSVGSLMELAPSAERRIRDLQTSSPKRKLEVTVSTENANQSSTGAKRKERPVKKEKEPIVDVLPPQTELLSQLQEVCDTLPSVSNIEKSLTEPIRDMEVDPIVEGADTVIDDKIPEIEGAACKELIEEMNRREAKIEEKPVTKEKEKSPKKVCDKEINKVSPEKETDKPEKQKVKKVIKKIVTKKVPSEKKVVENNIVDTKKVAEIKSPVTEQVETKKIEEPTKVEEKKLVENITKPQEIKKDDIEKIEEKKAEIPKQIDEPKITEGVKKVEEPVLDTKPVEQEEIKNGERVSPPTKPIERRRSKIFETAEKLQNMAKGNDPAPKVIEKPKKIFIPGVNVGGFKKEFERKASLTSTAPLLKQTNSVTKVPATQTVTNGADTKSTEKTISKKVEPTITPPEPISPPKPEPPIEKLVPEPSLPPAPANEEDELKKKREKAVNIISNAINKEGARKSKSRPSVLRKTPLPFGASGRSASGNITMLPLSPTELVSSVKNAISEESVESADINKLSKTPSDSKKSTVEITLRSSTLPPQRKTAKAEIKLNYPSPKPATMEFKTEVAHHIEAPQESFDRFTPMKFRSSSCDPEMKPKESPKERIIPISFEKEENKSEIQQPTTASKPPMPKTSHSMRSLHRHGSISRQSTQDSDSESCITQSESMEPIRKSPKEYIIPIAVEGGGYVTPRSASTEPSESSSGISSLGRQSIFKFGRPKRMSSILTDEDESPGSTLHRHNSIGRDSDTEEPRKEPFHMHRLRSSRPTRKVSLEHTDSLSSAEEDDDDDGFEILTAENLFSTLLSRVRNLTQRLNVEDNGRLGFPSSRLLGDFDRGTKMFMNDPLSRYSLLDQTFNRERRNARSPSASSSAPWRRSVSRDLANDIEKVFNNTPTASATLPRGKSRERSDINLSPEDTMALSYLTPGLSRRIRKHLFSSQIPSTHSSRNLSRHKDEDISEDQTEKDITSNVSNEKQSSSNSLKNKIINRLNRSISQDRGTSSKFLKSQDKVNSNFTSLNESFPDKTDLYYYRSLSKDSNENKNSTSEQTKNSNSNNNNNSLNDIITLSSLYNSRMPVKNITPIVPNSSTPSSSSKYSSNSNYNDVGSKVSRFLKSSFHEDYTRKNKEKEAQKVLREIRKKRSAKEDGVAKEDLKNEEKITSYIDSNSRLESKMQNEIERTLEMNQNNIEKTTDNVKSSENIRKSRISRLLRPKSYPNDYVEQKDNYGINKSESPVCNGVQKSEEISSSLTSSVDKTKTSLQKQNTQSTKTRASSSHVKPKAEKKSKVENTIRSLRERSLPHDTEYCATESNLIKRAISLEDFTTLSPPVSFKDKALQTSRKSVSKILGLFEKCDNQIKNKQKTKKSTKSEESTNKEITDIQNEEIKKNDSNKKTFIKKLTKDNTNKTKTTENNETNCDTNSRIPVSGIKKSENSKTNGLEKQPNPFEALKNKDDMYKSERKSNRDRIFSLKLDLKDDYDFKKERENDISNLITPSDDGEMSMCSDSHYHDSSPNSTLKIFSDDEECESVSDRIHRKSFYSRFNEKKKKKKSSSAGSYDFKEYLAKLDEQLTDSSSSRKNKSYDHRSSSTRSFNNYSTLRQPASYSRQTSLPTGSESHSGLYSTYNSYMDGYRSNKEKRSSIASYLPTVSKGSLSEVKDISGKTTKLTSQKEQSNNKFSEKNNDSNTNEKLVSPGPSNRNSYISQN